MKRKRYPAENFNGNVPHFADILKRTAWHFVSASDVQLNAVAGFTLSSVKDNIFKPARIRKGKFIDAKKVKFNLLYYTATNPFLINMFLRLSRAKDYLGISESEFEEIVNPDHMYFNTLALEMPDSGKIELSTFRIKHNLTLGPGGGGIRYVYPKDLKPFPVYFKESPYSSEEIEIAGVQSLHDADKFIKRWIFEEILALSIGMTLKNAGLNLNLGGAKGGAFLGKPAERIINGEKRYFLTPVAGESEAVKLAYITRAISRDWAKKKIVRYLTDKPAGDVHVTYDPHMPKVRVVEWFIDEHLKVLYESGEIAERDKKSGRDLASLLEKVSKIEKECKDDSFLLGFPYATVAWDSYLNTGKPVPELGTYTSKSMEAGGSRVRSISTALGTIMVLREVVRKVFPQKAKRKNPLEGMTVAIQGSGNAGMNAAFLLNQCGAKVVAISDSLAAIYDPQGLDIDEVLKIKSETGSLVNYAQEKILHHNDALLYLPVDILIPAAREDVITEDNVGLIKAKIIAESANGPTSIEADAVLFAKGTAVIYDTLANGGGVVVSDYERTQNVKGKVWSEKYIKNKLKKQLLETFSAVWRISHRKKVDLRTAGDMHSISRIREAAKKGLSRKKKILGEMPPSSDINFVVSPSSPATKIKDLPHVITGFIQKDRERFIPNL